MFGNLVDQNVVLSVHGYQFFVSLAILLKFQAVKLTLLKIEMKTKLLKSIVPLQNWSDSAWSDFRLAMWTDKREKKNAYISTETFSLNGYL